MPTACFECPGARRSEASKGRCTAGDSFHKRSAQRVPTSRTSLPLFHHSPWFPKIACRSSTLRLVEAETGRSAWIGCCRCRLQHDRAAAARAGKLVAAVATPGIASGRAARTAYTSCSLISSEMYRSQNPSRKTKNKKMEKRGREFSAPNSLVRERRPALAITPVYN